MESSPKPMIADPLRLREIRSRLEKAAAGPWYHHSVSGTHTVSHWCAPITDNAARSIAGPIHEHNADFIAHARQDIPWLLEQLEKVGEARAVQAQPQKLKDDVAPSAPEEPTADAVRGRSPQLREELRQLTEAAVAYMNYHSGKFYPHGGVMPTGLWPRIESARALLAATADSYESRSPDGDGPHREDHDVGAASAASEPMPARESDEGSSSAGSHPPRESLANRDGSVPPNTAARATTTLRGANRAGSEPADSHQWQPLTLEEARQELSRRRSPQLDAQDELTVVRAQLRETIELFQATDAKYHAIRERAAVAEARAEAAEAKLAALSAPDAPPTPTDDGVRVNRAEDPTEDAARSASPQQEEQRIEQAGLLRAVIAGIRSFNGLSPGFMNQVDFGRLAKRIEGEVRAYIQGRGGVRASEEGMPSKQDMARQIAELRDELNEEIARGKFLFEKADQARQLYDRAEVAEAQIAALREVCLCAALQMPDGYIFRGHRHDDCYLTLGGCERYTKADGHQAKQGFLTSHGRFVSRSEAADMHADKGKTLLFSEDLY
jgi:hypothetical protein